MKRLLIILCLLYVVSPLDFVPDVIPVVGEIDDAVASLMSLATLIATRKRK